MVHVEVWDLLYSNCKWAGMKIWGIVTRAKALWPDDWVRAFLKWQSFSSIPWSITDSGKERESDRGKNPDLVTLWCEIWTKTIPLWYEHYSHNGGVVIMFWLISRKVLLVQFFFPLGCRIPAQMLGFHLTPCCSPFPHVVLPSYCCLSQLHSLTRT